METNFDFGKAIDLLKEGKRVQRSGWNGKGMWLVLIPASEWHTGIGPNSLSAPGAHRLPWVAMKTADNGLVPWLASQTDILSEDWQSI